MRWNATFQYQKSSSVTRDANGFLVDSTPSGLVPGTICQVERNAPAQHRIGTDGQEFVYDYELFTIPKYGNVLEIGDTMEVRFNDGTTFTKKILGIDITDKKVLAVWL